MQKIEDWLQMLGMSEYSQAFAESRIDLSVLCDLTDHDLKELGVVLGDRRKMLRAIADIRASAASSLQNELGPQHAERRQVTVMFSDLVGSTELSGRMDPEDLRKVISTYQQRVAEVVGPFDGYIAKYMGDGVLIYFGYPEAHEDDAERAVRAGLALVTAVADLDSPGSLRSRIGIATGLVVVGDLIGQGEAQERGIIGETPNLAARLLGQAEPDMVVIDENTRWLVGDLFEMEDRGTADLKGILEPVRVWAPLGVGTLESRFEALRASELTTLVGRDEELDLLSRRWSKAKSGEGQVVLLAGEAGIGKSRLTAALQERLTAEPHTLLRYFCSPLRTDSPFFPVVGRMERAARVTPKDSPQERLEKIDAMLARQATSLQDAALLAAMLSLPNDGRYPAFDLSPQQQRERTLEALMTGLVSLAQHYPVLMILEDAHWIDPTTLELLSRTTQRIVNLRVLIVITYRPEFVPPWIGEPHVTALVVNRLTRGETESMIESVLGEARLSPDIRRDIIDRADGVPLFVEEITKAVLEGDALVSTEGEAAERVEPPVRPSPIVPSSLHASLMARLDRMGPAKEVAQIAAVIGREFSYSLLAEVAGKAEAELQLALDRLVAAGLLFRQGMPPNAIYLFKHALVQDAAYGSLLRDSVRLLHTRIAEALETQFPEIAENQPELLARHCTEAQLIDKAARLWGVAGQRSLARSALGEATAQLSRAIDQIGTLPVTADLRRERISLQVALINTLFHVKGYAAPETKAAVDRVRLLIAEAEAEGEPPEDPLLLLSVLFATATANFVAFNGDVLREQSAEFMALAEKTATPTALMLGHRGMGTVLTWTGDFTGGRAHLDRALGLYDASAHRSLSIQFGHDVRVAILCHRSIALWLLGYPEAALADAKRASAYAREMAQAATLMNALCYTSFTYTFCGDYSAAGSAISELTALADEKGALFWKTVGIMARGHISALTKRPYEAVDLIKAGMAASRSTGSKIFVPTFLSHLALSYAHLGQFDEAQHCIGEAISAVTTSKERIWEAEVHRLAGEIARSRGDFGEAEKYFQRALSIAGDQLAKSWELCAAMSMARLWRAQGKRDDARDILGPVYGWFKEGLNTLNLKQAKTILDSLQVGSP
jgi:class 3 adenylate cyclase/tetratricopeptide (TPR) repeat protein